MIKSKLVNKNLLMQKKQSLTNTAVPRARLLAIPKNIRGITA